MSLTPEQVERYSRQIILEEVGLKGQLKLFESKVLIVGVGGLGAPAAFYLAAAGIGEIGLVDYDRVELNNLQRQIIHFTADKGSLKIKSAKAKIEALNPDVKVRIYSEALTAANALEIIKDYDFVIDGTDNFAAKFLINDACCLAEKPFSHAGILRFEGQTMTVMPGKSSCYRCVFHEPPPVGAVPSCSQAGVLGVLGGTLGITQATESLKYLLDCGELLTNQLLTYNAKKMFFHKISVKRNPGCPVCGENPVITELRNEEQRVCPDKGEAACEST